MRAQLSLENQLDAYEATSGEERPAGKSRLGNWRMYAAAAGSGLALTTSAEAGIIYSGPLSKTASVSGTFGLHAWNTNIDGANIQGNIQRFLFGGQYGNAFLKAFSGAAPLINGSSQLRHLGSGAKISAGAGSFVANSSRRALQRGPHNSAGTWYPGGTGFAGIKIGNDFGWMKLKFGATYYNGAPSSITLLGWAYETTPNAPILAGQTTETAAVPERSTGLMALLAAGSVGVLAWRRRRQQLTVSA